MRGSKRLSYEWLVEFLDEYDDIVDVHHADTFLELLGLIDGATITPVVLPIVVPETPQPERRVHVGLVRDVFDDDDGLGDRMWAYLDEAHRLSPRFLAPTEDGLSPSSVAVPQRFHAEIQAAREEILPLLAACLVAEGMTADRPHWTQPRQAHALAIAAAWSPKPAQSRVIFERARGPGLVTFANGSRVTPVGALAFDALVQLGAR